MSLEAPECFRRRCSGKLIPLRSINKRKCSTCGIMPPWDLDPGQVSTIIEGLTYDNQVSDKEELKALGCTFHEDYDVRKATE